MSMASKAVAVAGNEWLLTQESGRGADMLSRLGILIFIVLPVVLVALGAAVAAILAVGWLIEHVIA
jgi:hypothetical protein